MMWSEIDVINHGRLDHSKALPSGINQEIAAFDFINDADKIDGSLVFTLDFFEQTYILVVWEKTIFTVVKLQVHSTRGEQQHDQHHKCENGFGAVDTRIAHCLERIFHTYRFSVWFLY